MRTEPNAARTTAGTVAQTPPKTAAKIVPAGTRSLGEWRAEAARARAELASTLDALEYKANVPKRLHHARRELTGRLRRLGDENPAALFGMAAVAAAVAGTVAWLGARKVLNR